MANYNVSECLTNITYVVSADTLTFGSVIGFFYGEDVKCGTVGDTTSDSHDSLFKELFSDCCECLSATTDGLNFRFVSCDDETVYNIEGTNFCSDHGAPLTGRTYQIKLGSESPFCVTFQGMSPTGQTNYFYVSGPFTDCIKCASDSPHIPTTYTGGTYDYKICDICVDSGTTTATEVEPPHPSYTNEKGDVVVQTQMVTLGGPNGLNS